MFGSCLVPVLKASWGKDAKEIEYFSDAEDGSIPTIVLGIPNTERGHSAFTCVNWFLCIQDSEYE